MRTLPAATAALVLLIVPAAAADGAMQPIIDALSPLLVQLAAVLIAALVGYAVKLIRDKLGIDIEAAHRDALQTALTNAAGLLIQRVGTEVASKGISTAAAEVLDGVDYVRDAAGDAVRNFRLPDSKIAEKIVAKVGVLTAPAQPVPAKP